MIVRVLPDHDATVQFGRSIAESVEDGAIIALTGPLGAGKTTLVKGMASALGVEEVVNSPTFTMLNEYHSGRIPLYHLDLYRLQDTLSSEESQSIKALLMSEMEELLVSKMICVIEWAELFSMPGDSGTLFIDELDHLQATLSYMAKNGLASDSNDDQRSIEICARGKKSERVLNSLQSKLSSSNK